MPNRTNHTQATRIASDILDPKREFGLPLKTLALAYLELSAVNQGILPLTAVRFPDGTTMRITKSSRQDPSTGMPQTVALTRIDGHRHLEGLYVWSDRNLPPGQIRTVTPDADTKPDGAVLSLVVDPEVGQ